MKIFPMIHSKEMKFKPTKVPSQPIMAFKKAINETKPIKLAAMLATSSMELAQPRAAAERREFSLLKS